AYARQLTFIEGHPAAVLIVEYYGDSEADLRGKVERLEAHLRSRGLAQTFVRAMSAAEQANVWGVRKAGLGLLMSVRGDHKPVAFMEDVAVPVDKLGDYVRAVQRIFEEHGLQSAYYAHASAGCLHIRPLINLKTVEGTATMRQVAESVLEVVTAMGGSMSGEHGDGLSRSCWNERLFGPELYGAFRELKRTFDPDYRLNPGKIVDAPPMTENLRYGAAYHTTPIATRLDFSDYGGFAQAVEMCNGAGVCRKTSEGVMCPSYVATREEEHSTRGRANALRAALSGHLPAEALTEHRMYKVMELCIECKGCKAECPSAVDMAKIKVEFLSQYYERHGTPLRARLFANIGGLSRMAYRLSPVINWLLAQPLVRAINERLFGIARQRTLPPFAAQPFEQWYAEYRKAFCARDTVRVANLPSPAGQGGGVRQVVLFHDTFNNYNHPETAIAATRLLDAAGFEVLLVPKKCCGRPMISKGLLEDARANAAHNVAVLAPYAERRIPIVGLEPSCLLTLRDEYLDLLAGDPRAKIVAEQAFMLEEFLTGLAERGGLNVRWKPANGSPRKILVHGHCYQKALVGTQPLVAMLRLPGWEVTEIPSGCCGMAGSFGYEAEHYDLSLKIGEDRLFPAVRAAGPEVTIAAAGMSCRHQIAHATGRAPRHPAELLAEALA
ncbi:MAG: 4Fe-4S dicluster domain-containing protein, partial [Chloroflexi bacterium]|nr:4Fe-4S dicluster domain-containing protein [Chloroflexota bacterium]